MYIKTVTGTIELTLPFVIIFENEFERLQLGKLILEMEPKQGIRKLCMGNEGSTEELEAFMNSATVKH
jgi:hypothetical protein